MRVLVFFCADLEKNQTYAYNFSEAFTDLSTDLVYNFLAADDAQSTTLFAQ